MFITFITISFFVLFISLFISLFTFMGKFRIGERNIKAYLFSYNNIFLATIGNIGSVLSLTTIIVVVITTIVGVGLVVTFGLLFGVFIGYFLFVLSVRKLSIANKIPKPLSESSSNTLADLVDKKAEHFFRIMQVFLYSAMIILELTIARSMLEHLFPNLTYLPSVVIFGISLLCALYVAFGGYLGVLRTDLFQLIVYITACLYLLSIFGSVPQLLHDAADLKFFSFHSPTLIAAVAFFIISYCFAWPDVWIRNVGTYPNPKRPDYKPLLYGYIGVIVVVVPGILVAIKLMILSGTLSHTLQYEHTISQLINPIRSGEFVGSNILGLIWLIAAAVCILITTLDTWSLGVVQHIYARRKELFLDEARITSVVFIALCSIISMFIDFPKHFLVLGIIATAILFANAMIIMAATYDKFNAAKIAKSGTVLYYLIAYLMICMMFSVLYLNQVPYFTEPNGIVILYEFVLAFIILLVVPRAIRAIRKR